MNTHHCINRSMPIIQAMQAGGFYDAILSGGPELDRVKLWLRHMTGELAMPEGLPLQYPSYPRFPGLDHKPFHDADAAPGARLLEASIDIIREEYLALQDDDLLRYTPPSMDKLWAVYLFSHMGIDLEPLHQRCPRTHALLHSLPRVCLDYAWGDALFSIHASDAHLSAHCSIDNLRLRCHLGIQIPPACEIRVGNETRSWQEGRNLLFEDSFEHEVWNRGTTRRAILIVDFWHPDLTDIEIEAISAGFRKHEVQQHILLERIAMLDRKPDALLRYLETQAAAQQQDPLLKKYWR